MAFLSIELNHATYGEIRICVRSYRAKNIRRKTKITLVHDRDAVFKIWASILYLRGMAIHVYIHRRISTDPSTQNLSIFDHDTSVS